MCRRSTSDASSAWLQQQLPLLGPLPQPARERVRERDLHELERDAARRARSERSCATAGCPLLDTKRVAVVRLEQQRLARRRLDREVDLEQLALRLLVAVLGLRRGRSPRPRSARCSARPARRRRGRSERRSAAARRSRRSCRRLSRASRARATSRGRRGAPPRRPSASDPAAPVSKPSVSAGRRAPAPWSRWSCGRSRSPRAHRPVGSRSRSRARR